MKKPRFVEDKIYHIYNRGVEKRHIFIENKDYFRFIHDLFEFNDESPTINTAYYLNPKTMEVEPQYLKKKRGPRKLLVEILAFCLMPNHFHLLLRQRGENGVVRFMQKMGTGYTMYFNQKNKRVGGLFQGRFKAVLVKDEAHFIYLPLYIHTNPIYGGIYRGSTSIDLKKYRWSSYLDYIGKKNFPSVTSRKFLLEFFGGEKECEKTTEQWIREGKENMEKIRDVIIEN